MRSADLLWNLASTIHPPFLSRFRRKALIDVDPGHLQIIATQFEFGLKDHDVHLSVGANLPDPDCEVPTLGLTWRTFLPFVYLPMWELSPGSWPRCAVHLDHAMDLGRALVIRVAR